MVIDENGNIDIGPTNQGAITNFTTGDINRGFPSVTANYYI